MTEVLKKNHFGDLTSFTGSVEKQTRAAPQEGKKLKKKLREKKSANLRVRADLDEVSELSRPEGDPGLRESHQHR